MEFLAVLIALFACVALLGTIVVDKERPAHGRKDGVTKGSKA